jgi:predicted nucleotide-binding protein
MPYHVMVKRRSSNIDDVVVLDLTAQKLRERILGPYSHNEAFFMRATSIPQVDVASIRITYTTEDAAILRPLAERIRSNTQANLLPIEWYIAELGKDVTDEIIVGPAGNSSSVHPPHTQAETLSVDASSNRSDVFVIHGRNSKIRDAMFAFLRAIGLHPLEWSQVVASLGEGSPYIGRVIDKGLNLAQAAVVLMTPDEQSELDAHLVMPGESATRLGPRPNVLLELGMALVQFPERTILVEIGTIGEISDIAGRHTIHMNNSAEQRNALAQRLLAAGCSVDLEGTDWLTVGDFSL